MRNKLFFSTRNAFFYPGARRSYLSHSSLINTMTSLGYPSHRGLCHGVACVAAQYFLSHKMAQFDQNLYFLANYSLYTDPQPDPIYRFLDYIEMAHSPEEYPILSSSNYHLPFQNVPQALAFLNRVAPENKAIQCIDYSGGIYSLFELALYFKLLRDMSRNITFSLGLIVSALHHSIMIAFDRDKKKWLLVDANTLPARYFDCEDDLAIALNKALSRFEKHTVFSVRFLAQEQYAEDAKNNVMTYCNRPEWRKLQAVTRDKARQEDAQKATWLMLACGENFYDTAKSLIQHGAEVDAVDKFGYTALSYAVIYRNAKIVSLLLENGARAFDEHNSYLQDAVKFNAYDIAEMLIKKGASVNLGNPSPVFLAARLGNRDMLNLFSKYGVIQAGQCFANRARLLQCGKLPRDSNKKPNILSL